MVQERYRGAAGGFGMCLCCSPHNQGSPTMNTITFLPGSTSHRSYCCLQGLERTSKGTVWFCIRVRAFTTSRAPIPPTHRWKKKALPHLFPQPTSMILHSEFCAPSWVSTPRPKKNQTQKKLHLSPSSWCTCTSCREVEGGVDWEAESQSLKDINTTEITAMCASMTAWLAAAHKIFIAHTGEKLQ